MSYQHFAAMLSLLILKLALIPLSLDALHKATSFEPLMRGCLAPKLSKTLPILPNIELLQEGMQPHMGLASYAPFFHTAKTISPRIYFTSAGVVDSKGMCKTCTLD